MKKFILSIFFVLIFSHSASAADTFEETLSDKIKEYGVFSGSDGIIYAGGHTFDISPSLFTVRSQGMSLICEAYGSSDGMYLTDSLEIPLGGKNAYILSIVKTEGISYLMLEIGANGKIETEYFSLINDSFTKINKPDYSSITHIAGYENGKIVSYVPALTPYNYLNSLKEIAIANYPLTNRINSLSPEETSAIRATITACADVMRFDIKNYDYDFLFKYILYTHKNFQILTDIPANSSNSSSFGYNNISIVSGEYIDYIMNNIFRITPEKPPVNNLLSRGFCYSDGYYYYRGGFDVYFATEILDIAAVYDLGGNVSFVIFSDIYHENNSSVPEYSYAILQKSGGRYSLLRLGMGENLPDKNTVKEYSAQSTYNSSSWDIPKKAENKKLSLGNFLMPMMLIIITVGTVGFVCSIIMLFRIRKR